MPKFQTDSAHVMVLSVGETTSIWPFLKYMARYEEFLLLKIHLNKTLFYNTKISENECNIPVIVSFFIFQQTLISPTGGRLKKTVFAFKRNMRGFRGVKPHVH